MEASNARSAQVALFATCLIELIPAMRSLRGG